MTMQLVEIPTGHFSISTVATEPGFVVRVDDARRNRGAIHLTPDQAADALEAFIASGVRLTDRAREMLVRSGSVGLTYEQARADLTAAGMTGHTRGDVLAHMERTNR